MDYLTKYTDRELVKLLQTGHDRAFDEIYNRYWGRLYFHAQRMLGDDEDCRDAVQEVFFTFWNRINHLSSETNISAYLHTMVRNRVLTIISRDKLKAEILGAFAESMDTESLPSDSKLTEKELIGLIDDEIRRMPEKMRQVFELSRNAHLSHKEIAQKMDVTNFTVKSQINNAIRRIKVRLGFK
jgi:RNA polymerase sigma-70 factor, Bacteroides expansion family 1